MGNPSQSYGASLAVWDHTVLAATRHKWTHPTMTPARQAGTRFTYPGGMEGWVDLGSLIAARPGIEPTIAWSQVRRLNRSTIKPLLVHILMKHNNVSKMWHIDIVSSCTILYPHGGSVALFYEGLAASCDELSSMCCNVTLQDVRVSEWVGYNGTSTQLRSLALSLTRKADTEFPTVKESWRYINLTNAI